MKKGATIVLVVLSILSFSGPVFALTPNDPLLSQQWYVKSMNLERAWGVTTGSHDVVVAVIDAGIDITHPDISNNIWTNPREISGNGIDDDGNGFVDDLHGWNFVASSSDILPPSDGTDDAFVHGTLVASLIAAKGNNGIGMAGVAWNVRIMPIVALDSTGSGTTEDIAKAVHYAVDNGANIINLSIEGAGRDPQLDRAFAYARSHGVLTITAAGNSDQNGGNDLDANPVYPACSSLDPSYGVITVGALSSKEERASFSDYGSCVSISAPGQDILAAVPTDVQGSPYSGGWNGTSLATPLVVGVAALVKSVHPDWSPEQIRDRLYQTAKPLPSVTSTRLGAGEVEAANALFPFSSNTSTGALSVLASTPGSQTSVRIHRSSGDVTFSPFRDNDARGAYVSIGDMNSDGNPEVAVVPASGSIAEVSIFDTDGHRLSHIQLPGSFVDGGLVAAVDGGFIVADADGGDAWGIDSALHIWTFRPYGSGYTNGVDMLGVSGAAVFAPRNGGGRLVAMDVYGNQLVSAFPFGLAPSGRWSLARIERNGSAALILSGPAGTKDIPTVALGQQGWEDISFADLENVPIMQSSGQWANDPLYRLYDSWPRKVSDR